MYRHLKNKYLQIHINSNFKQLIFIFRDSPVILTHVEYSNKQSVISNIEHIAFYKKQPLQKGFVYIRATKFIDLILAMNKLGGASIENVPPNGSRGFLSLSKIRITKSLIDRLNADQAYYDNVRIYKRTQESQEKELPSCTVTVTDSTLDGYFDKIKKTGLPIVK